MGCAQQREKKDGFKYLILGHENAGKTAIARALNSQKIEEAEPSNILIDIHEIHGEKRTKLTFVELAGEETYRKMWHEEFNDEFDAIVYVVDGTDTEKYPHTKNSLIEVLNSPVHEIEHIPVLVIVNKEDLNVKIDVEDLRGTLKTKKGTRNYAKVFVASAKRPETLRVAFDDLYAHFHPPCALVDSRYKEKSSDKHSEARSDHAVNATPNEKKTTV